MTHTHTHNMVYLCLIVSTFCDICLRNSEDEKILEFCLDGAGWGMAQSVRNGTQHVKITLQNSVSTDAQGRQKWRKFGQTQVDLENGCKMCIVMCYLQNENSGFFFLFQLFWYMPFPDFKCLLWLHNKMVKLQFLKGHHVYSHGSVYCLE